MEKKTVKIKKEKHKKLKQEALTLDISLEELLEIILNKHYE